MNYRRAAPQTPLGTEPRYAVGEFAGEQGTLVQGAWWPQPSPGCAMAALTAPAAIPRDEPDVKKNFSGGSQFALPSTPPEAWNETIARGGEGCRLEDQLVILTVPASFDEVARELTVTAAHDAGFLPRALIKDLLPPYAWLSQARNRLGKPDA